MRPPAGAEHSSGLMVLYTEMLHSSLGHCLKDTISNGNCRGIVSQQNIAGQKSQVVATAQLSLLSLGVVSLHGCVAGI